MATSKMRLPLQVLAIDVAYNDSNKGPTYGRSLFSSSRRRCLELGHSDMITYSHANHELQKMERCRLQTLQTPKTFRFNYLLNASRLRGFLGA
jgi:hypothetical protein